MGLTNIDSRVEPGVIAWRISPVGADGKPRAYRLHACANAGLQLTGVLCCTKDDANQCLPDEKHPEHACCASLDTRSIKL